MNEVKYEQDFYGWTQEHARLPWEGRFAELDVTNVTLRAFSRSRHCERSEAIPSETSRQRTLEIASLRSQ